MKAPDKIYVSRNFSEDNSPHGLWYLNKSEHDVNVEFIRKDALLEWANAELERLWELVPDADKVSSGATSPIGLRYLGQYMQMESVIEKLNNF